MNLLTFQSSLKAATDLLQEIGLFGAKGTKVISKDGVSSEFKAACQQSNYHLVYQVAIRNMDYDFTLSDNSFFQFTCIFSDHLEVPEIRFAFFQNPKNFISYSQFIALQRERNFIVESDEEIGDLLIGEYEQHLDEEQLNMSSTTIRYDIDPKNYKPLIHSTAHIHIGHLNDVRIPCDKVLTPLTFVLFVVKHVYYFEWKRIIEANNSAHNLIIKNTKNNCGMLTRNNWKENDSGIHENRELYLT